MHANVAVRSADQTAKKGLMQQHLPILIIIRQMKDVNASDAARRPESQERVIAKASANSHDQLSNGKSLHSKLLESVRRAQATKRGPGARE